MTAPLPAVAAHRQQIRDSYAASIAQYEQSGDYDNAKAIRLQLRGREQHWQTEDEAAS